MNRKYQAAYGEVPLLQLPMIDAPEIGLIPAGTTIEAEDRDSHWVKPLGMRGWAASTRMQRIMEVEAPDLDFFSNGHKLIDGKYRNFFGINNHGLDDYNGEATLKLFSEGKEIFSKTYTFADESIQAPGGRNFFVDTQVAVTSYDFASAAGSSSEETKGMCL